MSGVVILAEARPEIDWDSLTFSFTQTDRMYVAKCDIGEEWSPGSMRDFDDLRISPAAGVINYGQGLFEGMKAHLNLTRTYEASRREEMKML